jgi:manganese/iron transport system ATP-binding protein
MGDGNALLVDGVSAELGGRLVLQDVGLRVAPGEFVGLIGPNGAGKTTLLRCVLGLVPLLSGRVLVHGRPLVDDRSSVGYVPQRQEFAWDFPISVADAVMTGRTRAIGLLRRPGRADREAVDEALERAGIADLRHRPIGELSGGQRQRMLIARALALRPRVLLLDEPLTAVDAPTQDQLIRLLVELTAAVRAIVMTTHDIASTVRACNRMVLLNGTVVGDGTPADLGRDPAIWFKAFGQVVPDGLFPDGVLPVPTCDD